MKILRTCEDVGPLGLAPTRGGKGAGKGKLPTAGGGGGVVTGKDWSLSEITVSDTLVSLLGESGGVVGLVAARCCCCCALAALEAKASKDIWLICFSFGGKRMAMFFGLVKGSRV